MWHQTLPAKLASVTAIAFAPDSRTLYTGDESGSILAWDVATRASRELWRVEPQRYRWPQLWPSPDGSRLLLDDGGELIEALAPNGAEVLPLGDAAHDIGHVTPNGRWALGIAGRSTVGVWDLATRRRVPLRGPLADATGITFHRLLPDGFTLLTFTSEGGTLTLWDMRTGEPLGVLSPGGQGVEAGTLSPDGNSFAVARLSRLWVYDIPSRRRRHELVSRANFHAVAFHPDSRLLASNDAGSTVAFWDATTGERLKQFDWDIGPVRALAFAPDGLTCAAGGFQSFVVWDVDA
jgi:WD40 repeat protein